MGNLAITNRLKGRLAEVCFEEFSDQRNYAYLHSREIWQTMNGNCNELLFRHRFEFVTAFLPWEAVSEVYALSRPSNLHMEKNQEIIREPSFVYDYLTVSLRYFKKDANNLHYRTDQVPIEALNWVEVKFNKAKLSKNQKNLLFKTTIPTCIFRVKGNLPQNINLTYFKRRNLKFICSV